MVLRLNNLTFVVLFSCIKELLIKFNNLTKCVPEYIILAIIMHYS